MTSNLDVDLEFMSDDSIATECFTEFCESQYSRLVGGLTLLVADRWLAQDLTQETLARAWMRWDHVRTLERPDLWARRVSLNLARSHGRRQKARRVAAEMMNSTPTSGLSSRSEQEEALLEAVARLPLRQREAITYRFFDDLSIADTARIMKCREGTIKALTAQGISALRARGVTNAEVNGG